MLKPNTKIIRASVTNNRLVLLSMIKKIIKIGITIIIMLNMNFIISFPIATVFLICHTLVVFNSSINRYITPVR